MPKTTKHTLKAEGCGFAKCQIPNRLEYKGSEFEGAFDAYLQPSRFRINGCVERYQRTLNEEFIEVHEVSIREPREFLRHLGAYLVFYNSERIHHALGKQTPLGYVLAQGQLPKMSVTYTVVCLSQAIVVE